MGRECFLVTRSTQPSIAAEGGLARRVPGGTPARARRARDGPSGEPEGGEKRRERCTHIWVRRKSSGRLFFWFVFFGRAKKMNPSRGGGTPCQKKCASLQAGPQREVSSTPTPKKKGSHKRDPLSFGGGGGNRTRVRKPYAFGTTCLAVSFI